MDIIVTQRRNRLQLVHWLVQLNQQQNANNMLMLQVQEERARQQRRRRRTAWVRAWLGGERRLSFGHYHRLMAELREEDVAAFKNFVRVEPAMFDEIVERVKDRVWKQDTNYRKAVDPGLKVALTMRYLACGDNHHSKIYAWRVPHNTIFLFIPEVCKAIVEAYTDEVIACPKTPQEWQLIADQFAKRWNFHNCVGAIDGKHVALICPPPPPKEDPSSTTTRASTP